ncbi:hypothetical protein FIU97_07800 [Roseivivax sp. THAF40]|uniref:DUF6151 family protein n=1 Tax=unclassified Roseivivax TaxID=2639302 RepID=UPI001267F76A|nr:MULTISPECIES: DUF6151 family protein [unclassified Roseivivax]QFS82700.1 hypothetical protein FIV09_07695 [Roseivivax sp. THAF197b]QFT46469.1 hypothetical protein FIU97_07800 [Roseivivax sp. THAF40]
MAILSLPCQCGTCHWEVVDRTPGTLLRCYCKSCQSAQHHLGHADTRLSPEGGTLIFQTLPDNFHMIRGVPHLRAFRVTGRGVVRWYVDCCGTPVANTIATAALPFVGVVLPSDCAAFGPCQNHAHTAAALKPVKQTGMARMGWGVIGRGIFGKMTGRTRSPFFEKGHLRVEPDILDATARQSAGLA